MLSLSLHALHDAQVGGQWLAGWIVAAAAASSIGQYQAEMSSDSYQLQACSTAYPGRCRMRPVQ
jgi:hypothetical protein